MVVFNLRMVAVLGTLVATASCYSPNAPAGAPCGLEGACPSGQSCMEGFCRLPGALDDGGSDADSAIDTPTDTSVTCECRPDKTGFTCSNSTTIECATGCSADDVAGARCAPILPSNNVPLATASTLTADIQFGFGTVINTDTGAITGGYMRAGGPGEINNIIYEQRTYLGEDIGVFYVKNLEVPLVGSVRGVGTRPLVIVSANDMTIAGTLYVSGGVNACTAIGQNVECAGPGGGVGGLLAEAQGCGPGTKGTNEQEKDSGGGGGGGRLKGANGGASSNVPGGTGGAGCLQNDLEPIGGGSGGGAGSSTQGALTPGSGGGGGGAVQLVAANAIMITNGKIYANGAGGAGGVLGGGDSGGGAGGGAGGGILLEAQTVSINGVLTANGGGGGSAASANAGMAGAQGEDGRTDSTPAAGGVSRGAASGEGGKGGTSSNPTVGGVDINAGGGGGSSGVILVRALSAPAVSGTISPSLTYMAVRIDN